jgi:hypothetical protein
MTSNDTRRPWLRIASVSLFAAAFGISSAATANAVQPYNGEQGQGAYVSCFQELITHQPHDPPTQADSDGAMFDCCIITGGTWSSNDWRHGFCSWPATASGSGRKPGPGAIIATHPDPGRLAY